MPYPHADHLFVDDAVYAWCARDEQAVCAYHLGRHAEALDLGTELLAGAGLPDEQRARVEGNRDSSVAVVAAERVAPAPDLAAALARQVAGGAGDTTVAVVAVPDPAALERTLNGLLHCCADLERVARVVCVVDALPRADVGAVVARHPYLETRRGGGPLLDTVATPLCLTLDAGWEPFARTPLVARCAAVLAADPEVVAVALNRSFARSAGAPVAAGDEIRAADGWRYRRHPTWGAGPVLADVARARALGVAAPGPEVDARLAAAGLLTASLDAVHVAGPAVAGDVVAGPGAGDAPVAGMRAGELDLDLDPPWPIVAAAVVPGGGALRLRVRTAAAGEGTQDHEVRLDGALQVVEQRAVATAEPAIGPLELPFGDGVLGVADTEGGVRLACRREGAEVGTPLVLAPAGTGDERAFALGRIGSAVLLAFGLDGDGLGLALLPEDALHAALVP
jgi:hypothetical protein